MQPPVQDGSPRWTVRTTSSAQLVQTNAQRFHVLAVGFELRHPPDWRLRKRDVAGETLWYPAFDNRGRRLCYEGSGLSLLHCSLWSG